MIPLLLICLDYPYNLAKPDVMVQPRKMVQSAGISDNNFLQYTGHGTNRGHDANTDHLLEVKNEENTDNSVNGQHYEERHRCHPNGVMVRNNAVNRKRT